MSNTRRAPHEPSFVDELGRYRSPIRKYQQILAHWKSHAGSEAIWNKIQKAARANGRPEIHPHEFIYQVLSATWSVKHLTEHDEAVKIVFENCKKEIVKDVKQCREPLELLRVLGWRPDFAFVLQDARNRLEALDKRCYKFDAGRDHHAADAKRDSRRARRLDLQAFSQRMRNYLAEHCGQDSDEIIAELADIAFRKDVSVDKVRRRPSKAAKQRKR
jgi:hypothetical protein